MRRKGRGEGNTEGKVGERREGRKEKGKRKHRKEEIREERKVKNPEMGGKGKGGMFSSNSGPSLRS